VVQTQIYKVTVFSRLRGPTHIEPQGGYYGTPLQAATSKGKLDVVELLLEHGADPDVQGDVIQHGV
jgi:ankyrin repeat protein